MKSFLLILIMVLISESLYSQNTVLEGVVSDSINNPIELANVMAFYKKDSSVASFGVTDASGRYRLILTQGELYTLKSSFVGYATWESELKTEGQKMTQNLVLNPTSKMLNAIEVKYEFPITVSGDTIIYKTDEFVTGKERKLGDVLEALPGFEIDDNGDIKVQGKKVNKVLVEGKEFFDGDSKMATQNIPADAVDKIQLLRNYSDVSPMSGLGNDDNLAINVQLDDDKKNMWFGDVEVAAGPDQRFLAHPNLFYYSPKTNINIIGDMNNVGQQAFTLRDYFRFSGGVRKVGNKSGSTLNLSSDEFGLSLMQNNMAQNIESRLGAVNLNYQPNDKLRFSAYGIASDVSTLMNTTSNRTYIRTQENTIENTESVLSQDNRSVMMKMTGAYTPSSNVHLEYGSFLKASSISEIDNRKSDFGQIANALTEQNEKRPFSIDQNLAGYFALNEKNILSVESSFGYKKQVPEYMLSTGLIPLEGILPLEANDIYQISQDKIITTNALKAEINDYWILNNTNHISFSAGLNYSKQDLNTYLFQQQGDGTTTSVDGGGLDNDVAFQFQDFYSGIHYKTKLGGLTLSTGLNLHNYNIADTQLGSENRLEKQLVMPDLFAKYDFGSSKSLSLNYNLNAQFSDVQNIASRGVIRNYNSWFTGNRNLENILYHRLNVSYFNYNMFNYTNLFITTDFQKRYNDIIEGVSYSNTDRITFAQNVPVWNDKYFVNASLEKSFVKMKVKATTNLNYTKFQNEVEGQSNSNTSFTQQYTLSAESKFSNAPNFEIGFKKGWNIYETNTSSQGFTTNSPFIDVEMQFLKRFTFVVDYEYNNFQNSDRTSVSNYDFMNVTLYYQKQDSPWEIKLSANNLLETSSIRRDSFSANIVSAYTYQVMPRYAMLSVKYNL